MIWNFSKYQSQKCRYKSLRISFAFANSFTPTILQLSLKSAVALLLCIKSIFIEVVTPSRFVPKLLQSKLQNWYFWSGIIVHLGVSAVSNCMVALVDNQEIDIAHGEKWVPLVKEIQEDLVYHHNDLVLLQWLLPVWNGGG